MDNYLCYLPMYLFGGLGIGHMITGSWKTAAIFLLIAWIVAVANRLFGVLKGISL